MTRKKNQHKDNTHHIFTENFAHTIDDTSVDSFLRYDNLRYMIYSIEDRAIPSVIDGMKPGQRRLLYSMYKDGVLPGAKTKKSARLVNSATGQFHPHGGAAMYGTLVNLAVPYRRVKLIDGVGSFGRAPGGVPAQDRYTEARLSPHGYSMVSELKDRPVPFQPTYDGETEEPVFLAPQFPHLAICGAEGMAEGYSTNVPAHNPAEIMRLCLELLYNPDMDDEEILKIVTGPDWATGGAVIGSEQEIKKYITTGRGKLIVRGSYTIDKKQNEIIIHEIPAGTTVPHIYEDIRDKARSGVIDGIKDVLDASGKKHPIRIIIQAKRGVNLEDLAKEILIQTKLETTFAASMVALNRNRVPQWWSLKDQILEFLILRDDILVQRSTNQLSKANTSLMRANALAAVLVNKEKAVAVVMESGDEEEAAKKLAKEFGLTDEQGTYIANLPLKRLSKSSVLDAENDVKKWQKKIAELTELITNKDKRNDVIASELRAITHTFAGEHYERKTTLLHDEAPTRRGESKDESKKRLHVWKLDTATGILGDRGIEIPENHLAWCVFADGKVKLFDGSGLPKKMTAKSIAPDVTHMVACGVVEHGNQDLILVSSEGKVLRLSTDQTTGKFNPQGIAGTGVAGMKTPGKHTIVYAGVGNDNDCILTISDNGWKVTKLSDIPTKGRGGTGVMVHKLRAGEHGVHSGDIAPVNESFVINGKKAKISARATVTTKGSAKR